MAKSTKDIITELRSHAKALEFLLGSGDACEVMKAAANRLEKIDNLGVSEFSAEATLNADIKWSVGYRAGVDALQAAIADGSIDDLVTK